MNLEDATPMYQYYFKVQSEYPNYIVCMQLGDFYEIWEKKGWGGHAKKASQICDMKLTKRNTASKENNDVPDMCGFPTATREDYIKKMVDAGETVVVISQRIHGTRQEKNRNVTRYIEKIVSAGTVIDHLKEEKNNYFASLYCQEFAVGISLIDLSTGHVKITEISQDSLNDYLTNVNPTELIVFGKTKNQLPKQFKLVNYKNHAKINKLTECGKILSFIYELESPTSNQEFHLTTLGIDRWRLATLSFANLVDHLSSSEYNQSLLRKLSYPSVFNSVSHLSIPLNGLKSLEIFESQGDDKNSSLIYTLDKCKTPMGRRKLREWLSEPLIDSAEISARYDIVDSFLSRKEFLNDLKNVYDISRLSRRMFLKNLYPYEMKNLYDSLVIVEKIFSQEKIKTDIHKIISFLNSNLEIEKLTNDDFLFFKGLLYKKVEQTLIDWNNEKDNLFALKKKYDKIITEAYTGNAEKEFRIFETKESYKLKGAKGFYDFLVKKQKQPLIKLQQLTNMVEVVEPEWIEASNKCYASMFRYDQKARKTWEEFQQELTDLFSQELLNISENVATLDVLSNFAFISHERHYVRPTILSDNKASFSFSSLRHPVVEVQNKLEEEFIPNDVNLGKDFNIMCIYGANSSGKSTLLKAVAINIIMAQIGCFVSASEAKLTPFHSILTRMTTFDSLSEGLSTFTMEMKELKIALQYINKKSLFLLDEIGRGTSSEDGEAIAYATLDYLSTNENNSVVFFATHYHNLADKISTYKNISIKHMDCYIDNSGLLYFSRELRDGVGTGSYGIDVALSCGIPETLIRVAKNYTKIYAPLKKSRYNSNVLGIICPFCEKNPVQETHHSIDQKQGKVEWIESNGFKKKINHKSNLIMICATCHDKITKGELLVKFKR